MTPTLEQLTKTYLPPVLARAAKRAAVYPRYQAQARACRRGFKAFGTRYPQKILFIAGLPKSGTTWLEKMIAAYPGFHQILIPEAAAYELATGGSHDYDLPDDIFTRFKNMLALTKMHVHASPHNVELLRQTGLNYVILYRDLRDVAVSYFFYVRQTPWHPEYPLYVDLPASEGLAVFAERLLPAYVDWVRWWQTRRCPDLSLTLRYEELLADTAAVVAKVARHFGLDSSPAVVEKIVESRRFQRLSRGRENQASFFRKGVAGDWKNYFTPSLKELFKRQAGDFFIEFGYETSHDW